MGKVIIIGMTDKDVGERHGNISTGGMCDWEYEGAEEYIVGGIIIIMLDNLMKSREMWARYINSDMDAVLWFEVWDEYSSNRGWVVLP